MKNRMKNFIIGKKLTLYAGTFLCAMTMLGGSAKAYWDGVTNTYNSATQSGVYVSPSLKTREGKIVWTTDIGNKGRNSPETIKLPQKDVHPNFGNTPTLGYHFVENVYNEWIQIKEWKFTGAGSGGNCCHGGDDPTSKGVDTRDTLVGGMITDKIIGQRNIHYLGCGNNYFMGHVAICADCGEMIPLFIYASDDTLKQINRIQNGFYYYYLCPWQPINSYSGVAYANGKVEQAAPIKHLCKGEKVNTYSVTYHVNSPVKEYIGLDFQDYNNYSYNNVDSTSRTMLITDVNWIVPGYTFDGWYTQPEGGVKITSFKQLQDNTPASVLAVNESELNVYAHWIPTERNVIVDGVTHKVPYQKSFTLTKPAQGTVSVTFKGSSDVVKTSTKTFLSWERRATKMVQQMQTSFM